jgi:fucose permease
MLILLLRGIGYLLFLGIADHRLFPGIDIVENLLIAAKYWYSSLAGAVISLLDALFGSKDIALQAFPITGFFASVMYSVIFSLALNSVPRHHGTFSGILCAGIAGGAVVPH